MTRLAAAIALCGLAAWAPSAPAAEPLEIKTAVIRVDDKRELPLSRLDLPAKNDVFAGAEVGVGDNNTTGRFLGHVYSNQSVSTTSEKLIADAEAAAAAGATIFVLAGSADNVLTLADHFAGRDILIFNAAATDDRLRRADCRANTVHIAPSRAMLTDGLAQYMVWKRWTDWLLIHGSHPEDEAKAEAYRRSAKKFGARIVEERIYEDTGGARRSDSGHILVQKQMPVFTQRADDHHVVVAADEAQVFGHYLPYRTWDARPVVGDAGLITQTWHPGHEGWGATQMQRRFERVAERRMRDLDYHAWLAMRVIAEAVSRTSAADPAVLLDFMRSDDFEVAAFKGRPLSIRPWNNQLRHGILLADEKLVVSVSPQDEFLHQKTRLDTLGVDEPESECVFP